MKRILIIGSLGHTGSKFVCSIQEKAIDEVYIIYNR